MKAKRFYIQLVLGSAPKLTLALTLGLTLALTLAFAVPAWGQDSKSMARDKILLVLGDSLTSGYGLPAGDGFVPQLQAALAGKGVRVVNASIAGETSGGLRARLAWVLDGYAAVDGVILETGANDMLRHLPASEVMTNVPAITSELAARGIPVLIAGMRAPNNYGASYVRTFTRAYESAAAAHQAILYPFFLEGVAGIARYNQPDGLHPAKNGVAKIVKGILPFVEQLLSRMMGKRSS